MDFLSTFIDVFLHLDEHLQSIIVTYGLWTYALLFVIVFCETGLVVLPLLPGDSLIFAAGAFAATGALDFTMLFVLFCTAAILGDALNYALGRHAGPKIFRQEKGLLFNREHLMQSERFFEKHGTKTIIIARFVPIIRTFAPFVAGIGKMRYPTFALYNVIGALLWVTVAQGSGYLFGNIPWVRDHFELVILAIIGVSLLPAIIDTIWHMMRKK